LWQESTKKYHLEDMRNWQGLKLGRTIFSWIVNCKGK
jgi:hypothetical protein